MKSILITPRLARCSIATSLARTPEPTSVFKLTKLAWEYLGDSFGGRQLLFEEHSAGNLDRRRHQLLDNYDPAPANRFGETISRYQSGGD